MSSKRYEAQLSTEVCVLDDALLCIVSMSVCVCAGLFVEERPAEEELEGTLVHLKAQQLVLLHRGGPQGLPGQHSPGWELLCGGKQLKNTHCSFLFLKFESIYDS